MGIELFDVVTSSLELVTMSAHVVNNKIDLNKNTLGGREVGPWENICWEDTGPSKDHSYSFCNISHFGDIHCSVFLLSVNLIFLKFLIQFL